MSLGIRLLGEGGEFDEPIDDAKKGAFLANLLGVLGQVARATTVDELTSLGDELQSAGLVLRGELTLEEFLKIE